MVVAAAGVVLILRTT